MKTSIALKTHFEPTWLNTIIKGDCISALAKIPENSIDMVFADPPYNLQLSGELHRPDESLVNGVNNQWDKFATLEAYDNFTRNWLLATRRVLKPTGTLWVIGSYHNIFRVGTALQNLNFWILNDIIWRKNNPMPNFRGRRFTNAHETLIWATKEKANTKYTFNYEALKTFNDDLQMRSDWLLPICNGGERLKNQQGKKIHPTQKPESLLQRILLASTKQGDIVLDPFFGTGTTGVVAKKLGRHFLGIERQSDYIKAAKARLAKTRQLENENLEITKSKRAEPRIPFGALLENNLIKVGDILQDKKRKIKAKVRLDGSLLYKEKTASIHRMGAIMQEKQTCNGWTFWYIDKGNGFMAIDELRKAYRQKIHT